MDKETKCIITHMCNTIYTVYTMWETNDSTGNITGSETECYRDTICACCKVLISAIRKE